MLNKSTAAFVLLSAWALSISCGSAKHAKGSKNLMPGTWQSTPIAIDGDSKDWPSPYPNYDAKSMVGYATSNDRQNLYITMQTGDLLTQMKILKQGMTVTIDTNGKKDGQFNINYPLENDIEMIDPKQDLKERKDNQGYAAKKLDQKLDKGMQSANQFSLDGFSTCDGGYIITQTTPCGIKVRARIDEYRQLVWEAVVPFRVMYNKEMITEADAGKPVSVCFTVNKFVYQNKTSGGDNNNTGMNNAGGMNNNMTTPGRNSSRGGQHGGRSNTQDPYQQLYEKTNTWKQFTLVYQK